MKTYLKQFTTFWCVLLLLIAPSVHGKENQHIVPVVNQLLLRASETPKFHILPQNLSVNKYSYYYDGEYHTYAILIAVMDGEDALFGTDIEIFHDGLHKNDIFIRLKESVLPIDLPINIGQGGVVVDYGIDGIIHDEPIRVTIPYNDTNNDGLIDGTNVREEKVKVFVFPTNEDKWQELTVIGVQPHKNKVTALVEDFGLFTTGVDLLSAGRVDTSLNPVWYWSRVIPEIDILDNLGYYPTEISWVRYRDERNSFTPYSITYAPKVVHDDPAIVFDYKYLIFEHYESSWEDYNAEYTSQGYQLISIQYTMDYNPPHWVETYYNAVWAKNF